MSESPHGDEEEREGSVVEEENEIEEVERQSEGSAGIHEDLIDAVARGTEDPEVLREQDRFLPICNIARVMRRMVPESGKMSKESKEAIQEAVSEFISFITSEASDKCIEEQRKTITCDDLLNAIEVMGFDKYMEPLKLFLARYREATRSDRPPGEGGDTRTPSPPISTPLPIPIPAPFPHSASGPGGPIQPAPSQTTTVLSTAQGPLRISLPPGFVMGDKGNIMYKGPMKSANGHQQSQSLPSQGGPSMMGEGERKEGGMNGHIDGGGHHSTLHKHTQGSSSSDGPITIFVDNKTGQRYRSVVGPDGSQRPLLAPIRGANQNIKLIRQVPPSSTHPMDSSQPGPSTSSHPDHQSSQISSTTTTLQPSQSHYHSHLSSHSSYPLQSHSHHHLSHSSHPSSQYHHVSYGESSSNNHHSSMPPPPPPPPACSSTNYIQLIPHSSVPSSYGPPTTTAHLQYTHYQQDEPLMSGVEGVNGGREEKRQMTSSISNAKWNPSSGQYVVDPPKVGGDLPTKRRRINNRGH